MARNRFLLLVAALCGLMACSKSEGGSPDLTGKQFVCRDASWVVSVFMDGPITIYKDGSYVFQDFDSGAVGDYPELTFVAHDFEMDCSFSNPKAFTGTIRKEPGGIDLPGSLEFRQDDAPLDRNGDGLLD